MNILIITQKVDINDPVLGFFHRWIIEFSKYYEKVTVICLEKGKYDLPDNVKVLSLGKEESKSRVQYLFRFYKYIWLERKNYDAVFVHMNQEYIILGGLFWRFLKKKISMWRNHHSGDLLTYIACYLCNIIFCTSKYSYTARFKKTQIMPVGIDTDIFRPSQSVLRKPNSILFLGRISPVKKPHIFIDALKILKDSGVKFSASIYGDPLPQDIRYHDSLIKMVSDYDLKNYVLFKKAITNIKTPNVYSEHEIFVNLSSSGMYDKTIFEAMACGCTIFASNDNLKGQVNDFYILSQDNSSELADRLTKFFSERSKYKISFEKYVLENHSLKELVKKIYKNLC